MNSLPRSSLDCKPKQDLSGISSDMSSIIHKAQVLQHAADSDLPSSFLEHWIQDDVDTFSGNLLRYKVSAAQLLLANFGFSGTNVKLAPNPLLIPRTPHKLQVADQLSHEALTPPNVRHQRIKACPKLTRREAQCFFLELNDWNLSAANAKVDGF